MKVEKNLLFGFHEEFLPVSPGEISRPLRCRSSLHFSITRMNHSDVFAFGGNSSPVIKLSVIVGLGGLCMFGPSDTGGYGTVACPDGFNTQGWQLSRLSNNKLECIITATGSGAAVPSILLVWSDIVSTAPEGYANMTVSLSNFPGMENMLLSCPIFKKGSDVSIRGFTANPSTCAPGGRVRLGWTVENASGGVVVPGGYKVIGSDPQSTSGIDITPRSGQNAYYLNLTNTARGVFERAFVYTAPPYIETMALNGNKLSWNIHFASKIELFLDDVPEVTEPHMSKIIPENTRCAKLRCYGEYMIERLLHIRPVSGMPVDEIDRFYLQVEIYNQHFIAVIFWETAGLSEIEITVTDTKSIVISQGEACGRWENIYKPNTILHYFLKYKLKNGTSGSYMIKYTPPR